MTPDRDPMGEYRLTTPHKFKVVRGNVQADPDNRIYRTGDVLTSDIDLCKLHNRSRMVRKFENLGPVDPDSVSQESPDEDSNPNLEGVDLGSMTVKQLIEFAQDYGIEVSGYSNKSELVATISEALK